MTTLTIATKTFENLARNIAITSGIVAEQSKHDIRCIIDDCRVFWQMIDSEEAHFIYAFIGVAIGWLAVQTIKMGMAARTWCDRNGHTEQMQDVVVDAQTKIEYRYKKVILWITQMFDGSYNKATQFLKLRLMGVKQLSVLSKNPLYR